MNDSEFRDEDIAELAHDLYWSSDRSVNSIAEEFGLSKGGLYQHILPLPAEGVCPRCGGGVGYFNRTSRDRDEPTCLALCDNEEAFPAGGVAALLAARRTSQREETEPSSAGIRPGSDDAEAAFEDESNWEGEEFDTEEFEEDFDDEIAFDLEGGFAEIAGLAGRGSLSRSDFESDHLLADPSPDAPTPHLLTRLRSPLSAQQKTIVAGALLAGAAGLFFLRIARR